MGFTVRFILGAVFLLLISWSLETTPLESATNETPQNESNLTVQQKTKTESKDGLVISKLQKSEPYSKKSPTEEIARSIDIEKYISQDFHSKNNVYSQPTSPGNEKFINPDYDNYATTTPQEEEEEKSKNVDEITSDLTTPKSFLFDHKYRDTVDSVEQKLEPEDSGEEHSSEEHTNIEKLLEETNNNNNNNTTKSNLNYIQFRNILANNTENNKSIRKDLILEAGSTLDFSSSHNDTQIINQEEDDRNNTIVKELSEKVATSTAKTTGKNVIVTKPMTTKSSIISNKIEQDSDKTKTKRNDEIAESFTEKEPIAITKRGSIKFLDTVATSKKPEQLVLENQIVPIQVEAPKIRKTKKEEENRTSTTRGEKEENTIDTTVVPSTTTTQKEEEKTTMKTVVVPFAVAASTTTEKEETTTIKPIVLPFSADIPTTEKEERTTIKSTVLPFSAATHTMEKEEHTTIKSTVLSFSTAASTTEEEEESTTVTTVLPSTTTMELETTSFDNDSLIPSTTVPSIEESTFSEFPSTTELIMSDSTTIITKDGITEFVPVEPTTEEMPIKVDNENTTESGARTSKAMDYEPSTTEESTTELTTTESLITTEESFETTSISPESSTVEEASTTVTEETTEQTTNEVVTVRNRPFVYLDTTVVPELKFTTVVDNSTPTVTDSGEPLTVPDSDELNNEGNDGGNGGMIAAVTISSIGAVCLILLAGLLVIMRKRQKRFNYGQRCRPVNLDDYSMDNISVYNSVLRKAQIRNSKRSYGNPAFEDPSTVSHPLNFPALGKFANNLEDLKAEYEEVPQITARTNELPEGCDTKNRYANVIPLPETRVFLNHIENSNNPNSDYINANYVTGPKNTKGYYIATQAPMLNTVDDFWRMVWEQQCRVVLMLTHLFENGIEKCVDYLPPSEVLDCHRLFGDFQVTLKKREVKEKYVISILQLKNMVSNSWREVTHFWYSGWPEKGVPSEANSLIAFLIEARSYMKSGSLERQKDAMNGNVNGTTASNDLSPVVVHCSPGTGRTGVVIACDIAIREFEQTRLVDVPKIVYKIRRDRASAVQTKEQYAFIYRVINLYATKLAGGALESL